MPTSKPLRVLVAIDGSAAARAALETAVRFPWPDTVRVHGVVALRTGYFQLQSKQLDEALEASLRAAAASARDGDANARRAVSLLARLEPGRGNRAILVKVVEPVVRLPARAPRLPASVRANVRDEIAALTARRHEEAFAVVERAADRLPRQSDVPDASGW